MTSDELKTARATLGYSQADLSAAMQTPKRTIQDWEGGKCRLPGWLSVMMELLIEKDERVMGEIREQVEARVRGEKRGQEAGDGDRAV